MYFTQHAKYNRISFSQQTEPIGRLPAWTLTCLLPYNMANRNYFMAHSSESPLTAGAAEDACLLGSNYLVPILWVAQFDDADLTLLHVPCTDAEGNEVVERVPTLFTSHAKAQATYAARRRGLAKALGPAHADAMAEWEAFLSSAVQASHVQVDLTELWMMYDDPMAFGADVQSWLTGVARQAGDGWHFLCGQACLDDLKVRKYGLRGFPWSADLAWD